MREIIESLSAADQITIFISVLALIGAFVAILVPASKSDRDNRTLIRQQMNALLLEINTAIIEFVEMTAMPANNQQEQDLRTFRSMLTVQKASPLSMQAVSLINQMSGIMNEMDYALTADISRIASNWEVANQCYEIAIRKGENSTNFNKVVFRRSYAKILFEQGRYEDGRAMYEEALGLVENDTDINKHMNGYTWLMWYVSESQDVLNHQSSDVHYLECKRVYESISSKGVKSDALNLLSAVRSKFPT